MQISMPPARPPAGIRDLDPETPRLPAAQPAAARDPPPSWTLPTQVPTPHPSPHAPAPTLPGQGMEGRQAGKSPASQDRAPGPTRKWGGALAFVARPEARLGLWGGWAGV